MRPLIPLFFLAACGGGAPAPEPKDACDLSLDTLDGKAFVELEIQADGSEEPKPQARMMFTKVGGTLTMKYTVKNALHVYDYTCEPTKREGELRCLTEPFFDRACLALEVNEEGSCSAEKLRELGFDGDDEAMAEGIERAKKLVVEARKSPQWKRFQIMNNNVANTLMGQVFAKIDTQRCRLSVDDMFVTIFNGKRTEDFNPVGTNPFVPTDEDYLFEDCPKEAMVADLNTDELPPMDEMPSAAERDRAPGAEVYYHYVGEDAVTPEEGCTYSADVYANWTPVQTDVAVEPADGKLAWKASHTWAADDLKVIGADAGKQLKGGFFHMVRSKTCDGKTEVIDAVCSATRVTK